MSLGLMGLNMNTEDIKKAQGMYPSSTCEAAHEMLHKWRKSVKDPAQAFDILYKALMHKNVNFIAIANELKTGSLAHQ